MLPKAARPNTGPYVHWLAYSMESKTSTSELLECFIYDEECGWLWRRSCLRFAKGNLP
ncbi:hypothetical protein JOD60_000983 [Microbacterium aurum]|nr:hypothetical protein [Microbacterium aurum]